MRAIGWNSATRLIGERPAANLKQTFPLTASNNDATYNWDIGTIQRPNAQERQFEVASHRWIDLTDKSGTFGATILTDCKNGSDKPNDNTIRLTLLRSPDAVPEPMAALVTATSGIRIGDITSSSLASRAMRMTGAQRKPIGRATVSTIR